MNLVAHLEQSNIQLMMKQPFTIISEADEEHMRTSEHRQKPYKKVIYEKSDEEVLKLYKRMIGDDSKDPPLPRLWQDQNQTQVGSTDSPVRTVKLATGDTTSPTPVPSRFKNQHQQKSFELPSKHAKQSLKVPGKALGRNTTNYSEGYKEGKPFSLKHGVKTSTVYADQEPNTPDSPGPSCKQSAAEHFKKKLDQNVVKDKSDYNSRIGRTVMQIRTQDKKLRQLIRRLNKEQAELQESIRSYHSEYKTHCRDVEDRHQINYQLRQVQSAKQILTLDSGKRQTQGCKRTEIVQEYKPYTDKIQVQLRKLDALLKSKRRAIDKEEDSVRDNKLVALLLEPLEELEKSFEQQTPPVEGPAYKQIMKARKAKNYSKVQRLIGQPKPQDGPPQQQPASSNSIQANQSQINTYESGQGQMNVNQKLRNLLLN